eukprot:SAG22_NODE_2677_length_2315_cov_1.796029_1_plen_179_part_00
MMGPPELPKKAPRGGATTALTAELGRFASIAAPSVLISFFSVFQRTLNAMMVGRRLGVVALTGAALGNLVGSLCALSIIMGFLSALDTLGPQAMGAGRPAELGLLAQRGLVLCLLVFLPLATFWWQVVPILLYLGQPPSAVVLAGRYLRVLTFGMPGLIGFEVAKRWWVDWPSLARLR